MRKSFGTVAILTGNELPGPGRRGPASYKGQLFLEESTGNYYKALEAGPSVEYKLTNLGTASDALSGSVSFVEDPDHPGFAKVG